jgi:Tetratricopeptide repeat.
LGYQYDKLQKYDTALYYYDEALSLMSDTSNISYQNLLFYIAMLDCTSGEDFDNGILKAKKLVSQIPEPHRDWRLSVYKTH